MIRHSSYIKNIFTFRSVKPKFGAIKQGAINREQFVKYLDRHRIKFSEQKTKLRLKDPVDRSISKESFKL